MTTKTEVLAPAPESPAEVVRIDPESLEVADCYLANPSVKKVSSILGIDADLVSIILNKREVKAYIDMVFKDVGYNSRMKMRELMDTIISKKLEEMDDAGIGSNKDIIDIITLSHKMSMEHLDRELKIEQLKAERENEKLRSQVNVQINNDSGGSNYATLLEKLLGGSNAEDK